MKDQPKNNNGKEKEKDYSSWRPIKLPGAPDGYYHGVTDSGKDYIVPRFLLEDIKEKEAPQEEKSKLVQETVEIGAGIPEGGESEEVIGEAMLAFPPDPILSQFDLLQRHAEVMEMRNRHGISYKDACHRLYLAEVECFHAKQEALNGFKHLEQTIVEALADISAAAPTSSSNVGASNSARTSKERKK